MRPKNIQRAVRPTPRGGRRTNQVLGIVGLLIVGALVALSVEKLAGPGILSTTGNAVPTSSPSSTSVDASPAGSDEPIASVSPASPILEGKIPQTINGVTMTTQSITDATNLSNGPNGRALNASVIALGKQASDLELALSYDASGSLDITILGFRVDGITAAALSPAVLEAWLSTKTPGVTSADATLSGAPATKVSYGDGGADEYLIVSGDGVFVIETSDLTLAQSVAATILGTAPASSGAPSASVSPSP